MRNECWRASVTLHINRKRPASAVVTSFSNQNPFLSDRMHFVVSFSVDSLRKLAALRGAPKSNLMHMRSIAIHAFREIVVRSSVHAWSMAIAMMILMFFVVFFLNREAGLFPKNLMKHCKRGEQRYCQVATFERCRSSSLFLLLFLRCASKYLFSARCLHYEETVVV